MQPLYQPEGSNRKLLIIGSILLLAMLIVIYLLFMSNQNKLEQSRVSEMEHLQLNDEFTSLFRNISNVLKLDEELLSAATTPGKTKLLETKAALEKQINDGVASIKAGGARKIPQAVSRNRDNYIKLIEAIMTSRNNMELLWSSVDAESRNDMLMARLNTENKQLKAIIGQLKSGAVLPANTRDNSSGTSALQASLQKMRSELEKCQYDLAKSGKNGNVITSSTDEGKNAVVLFGTVEDLVSKASRESSLTMQRAYLRVSKEILAGIRTSFPDKAGFNQKQTEIDNMLKNIGRY